MKVNTRSILVSPLFQQASYIIFVLQKIENKIQVIVPSFTCSRHSEPVARTSILNGIKSILSPSKIKSK